MQSLQISFFLIFLISLASSSPVQTKQENIKRSEFLDGEERFLAEWEVDFEAKLITFDLTVQTTGYVGLGISPGPSMAGADIAIGGVNAEGESYFNDYYAASNGPPTVDSHKDWELLSASEENGFTKLKIQRLLETCDDQDLTITEDTQYLIWAIGTTDEIGYHEQGNRGPRAINLLDPPTPQVDTSAFDIWRVNRTMTIPAEDTTYWCSIHKAPNFNGIKHHIVGFKTFLDGELGRRYTHHATLGICKPPPGSTAKDYFDKFLTHPGDHCYTDTTQMPVDLCQTIFYVWAVGGEPLFLPEMTGYPIGETDEDMYVMFEIHYDNQDLSANANFETAVEVYYTQEVRPIDAELLVIMHSVGPFLTLPPRSPNFVTVGHCDPKQTENMIAEGGAQIFSAMPHSHKTGKALKVRQFRDGKELPWLLADDHYDFNYQANRLYREPKQVLPGDHLTVECTYDTSQRSNATIGGFPSSHEMCQTFLWVYPAKNYGRFNCESVADFNYLRMFGIENFTFSGNPMDTLMVTGPEALAGKTYEEVINALDWTEELKERIQEAERFGPHFSDAEDGGQVGYPQIDEPWAPTPKQCGPTTTGSPNGAKKILVSENFMLILIGSLLTKMKFLF